MSLLSIETLRRISQQLQNECGSGSVSSLARGTSCGPPEMFARRLIVKSDGSRELWKVRCYSSPQHGWVAAVYHPRIKLGMRMLVVKDDHESIDPVLSAQMQAWKPEQVNV